MNRLSKGIIFALFCLAVMLSLLTPQVSRAEPPHQGEKLRTVQHDKTGYFTFVGIDSARSHTALPNAAFAAGGPSQAIALADITTYAAEFGLRNPGQELVLKTSGSMRGNGQSFRYQQVYQSVPIIGGEIIVNYDAQGRLAAITGETAPRLDVSTSPTLEAAQAAEIARGYVARSTGLSVDELTASAPELWVYDPRLLTASEFPPDVVWRIEVQSPSALSVDYLVLINAHFGGVSLAFNQIDTFWGEQHTSTTTPQRVTSENDGLIAGPARLPNHANPAGATYNSNLTSSLGGTGSSTLVCSTPPTALTGPGSCDKGGTVSKANAAHYFAYNTVNYYDSHFHRNSINDAGMSLFSNIQYRDDPSVPYNNAYWDGTQMVYGDADFFEVDDVVAHELSHGVTQFESDLFYYYESALSTRCLGRARSSPTRQRD
jgi:Zn-dependent metalloprotease